MSHKRNRKFYEHWNQHYQYNYLNIKESACSLLPEINHVNVFSDVYFLKSIICAFDVGTLAALEVTLSVKN